MCGNIVQVLDRVQRVPVASAAHTIAVLCSAAGLLGVVSLEPSEGCLPAHGEVGGRPSKSSVHLYFSPRWAAFCIAVSVPTALLWCGG